MAKGFQEKKTGRRPDGSSVAPRHRRVALKGKVTRSARHFVRKSSSTKKSNPLRTFKVTLKPGAIAFVPRIGHIRGQAFLTRAEIIDLKNKGLISERQPRLGNSVI